MKGKIRAFFRENGHYVLGLVMAAVILLSALWTRNAPAPSVAPAQMDQSQRLADITPSPAPFLLQKPAEGEVLRPFSREPRYFSTTCTWHFHYATDISVQKDEPVYAAFSGTLRREGEALCLDSGEFTLRYLGIDMNTAPREGPVKMGEKIASASGHVSWEGDNILCLTLYRQGVPVDFEAYLSK